MNCRLCQKHEAVEDSHLIPALAHRAMKKQSPTAFFRRPTEPNRRIQDGVKCKLLCPQCEDLFNTWETQFSNRIFNPLYVENNPSHSFQYEEWFLKFAVSVSWRTLTFLVDQEPNKKLHLLSNQALNIWKDYLLGESDEIGLYRQHLIVLDQIENSECDPLTSERNTYIKAAICFDTVHNDNDAYIFSKICNVVIAGTIYEKNDVWEGTQIHKRGSYAPGKFTVPNHFRNYLDAGVEMMLDGRFDISQKQSDIIGKSMKK
jgi:hypothetical protein